MVTFEAELWIWAARPDESWTFVSLPVEASAEIRDLTGGLRRGFGSVRVRVTIGGSTWQTSIFPDSKRDAYVLPVKRAIRKAEALDTGAVTTVTVELIEVVPGVGQPAVHPEDLARRGELEQRGAPGPYGQVRGGRAAETGPDSDPLRSGHRSGRSPGASPRTATRSSAYANRS